MIVLLVVKLRPLDAKSAISPAALGQSFGGLGWVHAAGLSTMMG
jgi:hypothetical protein